MNNRTHHQAIFRSASRIVLTTVLWAFCLVVVRGQGIQDSSLLEDNVFSPGYPSSVRLLFDYYHHNKPATKIDDLGIATGSWMNNDGRYAWDDFVHTNTFDPVFTALEKEYAIRILEQPYSDSTLTQTDVVVIVNPDNPEIIPRARKISDDEIEVLKQFVGEGGSLMITINAGGVESESFEAVQLRKLVRSFGLDWNDDNTHASDIPVGNEHPYFYDVPVFHYGGGCTLKILPGAKDPVVLMEVFSDAGYPDAHVKGPGIVEVRYGKGKVILVGDTGSWTGNISRPWADNEIILKQLVRYLKPDRGITPPQFPTGKSWQYQATVVGLHAIPIGNPLSQFKGKHFRIFSPRPITNLPYFKATAEVTLTAEKKTAEHATTLRAGIDDFRWLDGSAEKSDGQAVQLIASRQGKVSHIKAEGSEAKWLAPQIPLLVALLPVDGIRVGDRWKTNETLRIPIVNGTDLAPVRSIQMETEYMGDTKIKGHDCRLLQASGDIWLDEAGVAIDDLLPEEEVRLVGGPHYEFLTPRGGKLLFKREQWVDRQTGRVVKSRLQTRIVAWIHDLEQPVSKNNEDKDNHMVVSLAEVTTFLLK